MIEKKPINSSLEQDFLKEKRSWNYLYFEYFLWQRKYVSMSAKKKNSCTFAKYDQ